MIEANKSVHLDIVPDGTVPTANYQAGTIFSADEHNIMGMLIKYAKGAETSLQVKVEASIDSGVTYGQQTVESASGGTITASLAERTFAASGNYWVVIQPIKADSIKISYKATTGGTITGTVGIDAQTGWM